MDSENDKTIPMPGLAKPQDKKPRKPRPSELAAKAAKKKKHSGATNRPLARSKAKAKKRPKVVKTKRKPGKVKVKAPVVERCERLDLRLTKAEKVKITARAKKLRRTLTSVISEAIANIR